ncbi:helix-turn-helix domain-containing protein [Macrococcus capreoli]|uniref:helix-turn-helix domain-containing protein n=1 Tax=Macrococcus capreoli TaxID=2982690 RepID=UPI0021D5F90E|nr:RodZ domain-containing protein [Macrococcus sp. TMW 2.2395]MCU7556505.1 helix-turn-helix domain-containing protein [Macrococcus sp. TMW 2.2395]
MKLIGQKLRSKRESLGMTLIDLEKKVKIQKKYIEMIENNAFDRLPNPDYARGFIEKYAKAVNVDAVQLIKAHENELPEKKMSAKEASHQIKSTAHVINNDKSVQKLLLGLAGIIGALFVIWLICTHLLFTNKESAWQAENINKSRNVSVEQKTVEKPTPSKTANEGNSKSKTKTPAKVEDPLKVTYKNFDGANLAYEISSKEQITVKIDSKIPTWVQIYDDNKKNYAYKEMKSETMKIDKDAKTISLISGNSTSLDVYINGKKVIVPKEAENLITRTYYFKIIK